MALYYLAIRLVPRQTNGNSPNNEVGDIITYLPGDWLGNGKDFGTSGRSEFAFVKVELTDDDLEALMAQGRTKNRRFAFDIEKLYLRGVRQVRPPVPNPNPAEEPPLITPANMTNDLFDRETPGASTGRPARNLKAAEVRAKRADQATRLVDMQDKWVSLEGRGKAGENVAGDHVITHAVGGKSTVTIADEQAVAWIIEGA